MSPSTDQRRSGRLVAGTEEARRVASAGGRAAAESAQRRRLDEAINRLIEAAPVLTARQRDRIVAVFACAERN